MLCSLVVIVIQLWKNVNTTYLHYHLDQNLFLLLLLKRTLLNLEWRAHKEEVSTSYYLVMSFLAKVCVQDCIHLEVGKWLKRNTRIQRNSFPGDAVISHKLSSDESDSLDLDTGNFKIFLKCKNID